MIQRLTKDSTIEDVRDQLTKLFKADIHTRWDTQFKMYHVTPLTELGNLWIKQVYGLRYERGRLMANSEWNAHVESMLKCGLTIEEEQRL